MSPSTSVSYLDKMSNKLYQLKHVISYYAFIFIVWGLSRALVKLPVTIEELLLKPLIWLVPLIIILKQEKLGLSSLGWGINGLLRSLLYLVIGGSLVCVVTSFVLGIFFGEGFGKINLFTAWEENKDILLSGLWVSLVTATVEESVLRGYIFNRLNKILNNELVANLINTVSSIVIHVPVFIFIYKLDSTDLLLRGFLSGVFAFCSAYLFARTGNIVSSILFNVLWPWILMLFK